MALRHWFSTKVRWTEDNLEQVLVGIAPVVLSFPALAVSDEVAGVFVSSGNAGLFRFFALVIFVVLSLGYIFVFVFHYLPRVKNITDLEDKCEKLEIDATTLLQDARMLVQGYLVSMASEKLRFGSKNKNTERITLYVYSYAASHFVQVGRYSANPEYMTKGRQSYPSTQGSISQAWQNGKATIKDIPCIDENPEGYCDRHMEFGFSEEEIRDLKMKSRFYYGYRVLDAKKTPVSVVIVESTDPERFSAEYLDRVFDSFADRYLSELSERVSKNLPDIPNATEKGL